MTWLEADAEAEGRYRALDALAPGPASVPRLVEALGDASWRVRRLAANRLAQLEPSAGVVQHLVSLLGRRGDTGARNAAASVLSQLGAAALPAVVQLLRHEDPDQRKFAADILGELGRPEAVDELISALADGDANVRVAAGEALGRIGGSDARRALEGLLRAADPLLRVCGLEGLARLRAPPPLPMLVPLLDDALTRPSAFRLLGQVPHPTAWRRAVLALRKPATRDAALVGFASCTPPLPGEVEAEIAVALKQAPDAVRWLEAALTSGDLERRRGALCLARALRTPSLAVAMARAAGPDGLAEYAAEALLALGLGGARALLDAGPALADLSGEARAVAGEALLALARPSLVDRLTALLRAGDQEWAELAARALGRTGAQSAIAPLTELFDDDALAVHAYRALVALAASWPQEVRAALEARVQGALLPHVVRAWAEVVGAGARPVLARALHDERDDVRAAAAEAAVFVLDAPALVRAGLMDESPRVRRAAARALASLSSADAAPLLSHALIDADPGVLALACQAAPLHPGADTSGRLEELSRHADASVALSALDALAALGPLPLELLLRALEHPGPEVVRRVFELGADQPGLLPRAEAALAHPRWEVRAAAARLLAVSGSPSSLECLEDALAREADEVARELLTAAASAVAARR
ncbi:MAG: HEAT repeat domain-containing protein [Myxococcota bacterium]